MMLSLLRMHVVRLCWDIGPCLIRLDQGVLVPSYISPLYPLFWLSRLSNIQHILPDSLKLIGIQTTSQQAKHLDLTHLPIRIFMLLRTYSLVPHHGDSESLRKLGNSPNTP
jgi:hypothetical protein